MAASYTGKKADELIDLLVSRDTQLQAAQQNQSQLSSTIPLPSAWNCNSKDPGEEFEFFMMTWENYAIATNISRLPAKSQVAIFWSALGSDGMKKCIKDWKLTAEQVASVDSIEASIKDKLKSSRISLIDRIRFGKLTQKSDESLEDFVKRVEKQVEHCSYGTLKNELTLQQVLLGMSDLKFQEALLNANTTEAKLTWDSLKVKVAAKKNRDDQLKVLSENLTVLTEEGSVKKIKTFEKQKPCKYCGYLHEFNKKACPAYGKSCKSCGGENHYARVCMKTKQTQQDSDEESDAEKPKKNEQKSKKSEKEKHKKTSEKSKVKQMTEDSTSSSESEGEILKIQTIQSK